MTGAVVNQIGQPQGLNAMPYLNQDERRKLLDDLRKMSFNKARGKLRRMDPTGRLAFLRNVQHSGQWMTRYDLPGLGTRVTLIEEMSLKEGKGRPRSDFQLREVIVEPTPDNRT
jgi:hypothetical protein